MYGHAQFNMKDIPFLSVWLISTYYFLDTIEDIFYDRCWYIAKSNPLTEDDIVKNKKLADIYINMKYLGFLSFNNLTSSK